MATIFSHFVLGWGAYRFAERGRDESRLGPLVAGALSVLPDLDSLGLMAGIPYGDPWGHRGMTHSLAFAAVVGTLAALALRRRVAFPGGFAGLAATLALITASHGVLDGLTDGGLGIAFFAPFDPTRHFLPIQPIPASPITGDPFDAGVLSVVAVEIPMIWTSSIALAVWHRPLSVIWRVLLVAAVLASAFLWVSQCL